MEWIKYLEISLCPCSYTIIVHLFNRFDINYVYSISSYFSMHDHIFPLFSFILKAVYIGEKFHYVTYLQNIKLFCSYSNFDTTLYLHV